MSQRARILASAATITLTSGFLAILPMSQAQAACAQSGPASAVNPLGVNCCVVTDYELSTKDTRIPFKGVPVFKNGPGPLKMTVTKEYSGTATYEVVFGGETQLGGVLAKVKASVSVSASKSNTTTSTNAAELDVPRGKYGNMQYVSWGKDVTWAQVRTNANCSTTTLASGRIKFPTNAEGWHSSISNS